MPKVPIGPGAGPMGAPPPGGGMPMDPGAMAGPGAPPPMMGLPPAPPPSPRGTAHGGRGAPQSAKKGKKK